MSGFLLDTSAILADAPPPGDAAISVVTIGELRTGIFTANDPVTRAQRNRKLSATRRAFLAYEVNQNIAERFGEITAFARLDRRLKDAADHLIIATAAEYGLTLYTSDRKQGKLAEDLGLLVEYAS